MRIVSRGTWLAQDRHQWGLGGPKCLEQSRHMLVLLGPLVSHTISTSEAVTPQIRDVTGQRQTYTYASEALTY